MKIRKCRCSQPSRQGWISEKSMETSSCKRSFFVIKRSIKNHIGWLNIMKKHPPAIRVNFMDELDSVLVESALLNPSDCHCYIWEWRTENFSGSNLGWLLIETELCQMMPVRSSKLCIIIKYISLYITIMKYIII